MVGNFPTLAINMFAPSLNSPLQWLTLQERFCSVPEEAQQSIHPASCNPNRLHCYDAFWNHWRQMIYKILYRELLWDPLLIVDSWTSKVRILPKKEVETLILVYWVEELQLYSVHLRSSLHQLESISPPTPYRWQLICLLYEARGIEIRPFKGAPKYYRFQKSASEKLHY